VKHARKAQALGVDMVEIIGAEAGGHPGMALVGTIVQAALAARDITIPLVVGGGIGTGAQLVAALALGADGVLMGTRFLVAEEVWAHPAYKRRLLEAEEADTMLVMQSLRNTVRALRNETTERIQAIEKETPRRPRGTDAADQRQARPAGLRDRRDADGDVVAGPVSSLCGPRRTAGAHRGADLG
jgi:Dioxygenases related to 2-nitropropane dioxygenase